MAGPSVAPDPGSRAQDPGPRAQDPGPPGPGPGPRSLAPGLGLGRRASGPGPGPWPHAPVWTYKILDRSILLRLCRILVAVAPPLRAAAAANGPHCLGHLAPAGSRGNITYYICARPRPWASGPGLGPGPGAGPRALGPGLRTPDPRGPGPAPGPRRGAAGPGPRAPSIGPRPAPGPWALGPGPTVGGPKPLAHLCCPLSRRVFTSLNSSLVRLVSIVAPAFSLDRLAHDDLDHDLDSR